MEGLAKQLSKELEDPKFAAVYYRGLLQDAQDIITSLEASVADAQELYAQCKAKLERAEEVIKKIANGGYTGASFLAMEYFKQ